MAQSQPRRRVGESVGKLVVEIAIRRFQTAFDGEHAIHEVAEEAQLDAHRGEDPEEPRGPLTTGEKHEGHRRGSRGEDDAEDGDLVRAQA